jgi:hypothetical protein
MDAGDKLDVLLELAERIGLTLRKEALGGEGGGYCVMRGKRVLFVDTMADPASRYERTLAAMAGLSEIEGQFIRPDVREDLERARGGAGVDPSRG